MTNLITYDEPILQKLKDEYELQIITMLIGGNNFEKKDYMLKHLCSDMFEKPLFKTIFKTIEKLKKEEKEIEIGNLCEALKYEEQRKICIEINKQYITNMNCNYYLEKLHKIYIKKLLKECETFEGYKEIEKIKQKYSIKNNVKHISDSVDELIVEYYNKWGNQIKTYYPQIDNAIGTLQGGDLFILAGATGMGKTCMALNLVLNMAKNKHKVLYFSLEMPLQQLQNRIISSQTQINSDKYRKFNMTNFEQKRYTDFALSQTFSNLPIEVCEDFNLTTENIKDVIVSVNPDIVFIDYLGLIKSNVSGNTYEKTSQISRDLKITANETNKPLVVLHQLSRIKSDRKEKRPLLSDLRDSGKIEQDADFICFVYREAYYNKAADKTKLEFLISKSRHCSGRNTLILNFESEKQLITDKIGEYMEKTKQGKLDV